MARRSLADERLMNRLLCRGSKHPDRVVIWLIYTSVYDGLKSARAPTLHNYSFPFVPESRPNREKLRDLQIAPLFRLRFLSAWIINALLMNAAGFFSFFLCARVT